jgi:hypothetical protein
MRALWHSFPVSLLLIVLLTVIPPEIPIGLSANLKGINMKLNAES